ncbi:unnamed protein product, partial [marine sediment metagenome]
VYTFASEKVIFSDGEQYFDGVAQTEANIRVNRIINEIINELI